MTASTPGRHVDAGTLNLLNQSYAGLVKAGQDSVRAAWRFGQCVDSFSEQYYMHELADAMDLSTATLYRYRRLYLAYQRPELALAAAEQLETFNIDTIWRLQNDLHPVRHGRSLRGRHWKNTCHACGSTEVDRIEVDKDGKPIVVPTAEDVEAIVNGPGDGAEVPQAQFSHGDLDSGRWAARRTAGRTARTRARERPTAGAASATASRAGGCGSPGRCLRGTSQGSQRVASPGRVSRAQRRRAVPG